MQMGEAAATCLMRSISHPLLGFKEGDRLRALTTSVSFGRFMNEPLDWEKWSSFSHNRTLEDVQKYSRPGAVAEKKAFFEAYYKNLAPKKGAKPPKTETKPINFSDINENKPTNIGVNPEIALDKDVCLPSTNLVYSEIGDVTSACHVEREKTSTANVSSPNTNLVYLEIGDVTSACHVEREKTSTANVSSPNTNLVYSEIWDVTSACQVEREKTPTANVSPPNTNLVSSNNVVKSSTTNLGFSEIGDVEGVIVSASQVAVKDDTLNKIGVESEISSNEDVGLPRANLVSSENKNVNDMITKNVSLVGNLNHVEKNKKRQVKDKVSMKTKTEIYGIKSSSRKTPPTADIQHKKAVAAATEKKKSVLQSLHSSIKFPASLNKSLNLVTFIKPKDRPIQQTLTRVSSINAVKKTSQVPPRPEYKRNSEASIASTKKPRSATVFSSFSFKSDERAAKRKEFFQKLEEKGNINKTEKTQLQPKLKEKGNKRLPWGGVPQAKISTSETTRPSNIIQKVPPKFEKKNFVEINKKKLSSSIASLLKR